MSTRPHASLTWTTGVASCVLLLPTAGCRRPSAELTLPDEAGPATADAGGPSGASKQCDTPKPPPGSADDHEPPVILGARFVARDRVQLTFSEALGPVDAVNPRQFRLSHAYTMVDGDGEQTYATGYYYDLAGPDAYDQPLVVIELERYEGQPEVLALTLSRPVPIEVCEAIADSEANFAQMQAEPDSPRHAEVGLYLHYTQRGSDGVRDRVNNPLGEFGADWALNFGTRHKTNYGADPVTRLDLLPRLVCPDASLGGAGQPPGPM